MISSKVFRFPFLCIGRGAATPVSPPNCIPHFVRRKSGCCNESIYRCSEHTTHDRSRSRWNRPSLVAGNVGSKYVTRKSLAAKSPPRGTCERLKTLRRAIRYPRNYVYPSPLVWKAATTTVHQAFLRRLLLVDGIDFHTCGTEYVKREKLT